MEVTCIVTVNINTCILEWKQIIIIYFCNSDKQSTNEKLVLNIRQYLAKFSSTCIWNTASILKHSMWS